MIFSRGFKRHTTLKHVLEELHQKNKKNILITIDKFMNIYGEKIKNMQICVMSIPVSKKMPEKCFHLLILTPTSCRIAGSFKTSG